MTILGQSTNIRKQVNPFETMTTQAYTQIEKDRASDWALYGFAAFTLVTIAGYATFGAHPELIARVPGAVGFYSRAFRFFAVTNIWLAFVVFALLLARSAGRRWIPAFVLLYSISLASELSGTITGMPFGEYRYSEVLTPMWLGHVPIVIPLSWFFMSVTCYAIARFLLPDTRARILRVLIASALLVSWDLSLDPAMSFATHYWMWGSTGAYYGMPWLNLFGWYVTGLALMTALYFLDADRWIASLSIRRIWIFFFANLALPMAMNAATGLWGAVISSILALGGVCILARRLAVAAQLEEVRRVDSGPPLRAA
ncbi:MAG: carotenoid biosynthesis protein [Gemmatimonadales bacterium]